MDQTRAEKDMNFLLVNLVFVSQFDMKVALLPLWGL